MTDAEINSGDLVVIEKRQTADIGDIVVALTDDRLSTLKRLRFGAQQGRYLPPP